MSQTSQYYKSTVTLNLDLMLSIILIHAFINPLCRLLLSMRKVKYKKFILNHPNEFEKIMIPQLPLEQIKVVIQYKLF